MKDGENGGNDYKEKSKRSSEEEDISRFVISRRPLVTRNG